MQPRCFVAIKWVLTMGLSWSREHSKLTEKQTRNYVVDAAADAAKAKMKASVLDTFKVLFDVKFDPGPWKYSKTKTPDQNINVCSF